MIQKTVSLDEDIAAEISREADAEERPFSQVLNRRLRALLKLPKAKSRKRKPRAAV